jgi:hypothetical protein
MILLLDLDGVLVESRAYHRALQDAVAYFGQLMGAGPHSITEEDIDQLEAAGITAEWESGAICTARLFLDCWHARGAPQLPPDPWQGLAAMAGLPGEIARPDFAAVARQVRALARPGESPSRSALRIFLAQVESDASAGRILSWLLGDCYRLDQSPTQQVVQSMVLGDAHYEAYYGQKPRLKCASFLETLDRPLLNPDVRDKMLACAAPLSARPAIYTARPSVPPPGSGALEGRTPEAEIGRRVAGLGCIPVIGYGHTSWLAQRTGRRESELVKPSPVHMLAAAAVAAGLPEADALHSALRWLEEEAGAVQEPCPLDGETIHLFEDSAESIRRARSSLKCLSARGADVGFVGHGIGRPGTAKCSALEAVADDVHESINDALASVIGV